MDDIFEGPLIVIPIDAEGFGAAIFVSAGRIELAAIQFDLLFFICELIEALGNLFLEYPHGIRDGVRGVKEFLDERKAFGAFFAPNALCGVEEKQALKEETRQVISGLIEQSKSKNFSAERSGSQLSMQSWNPCSSGSPLQDILLQLQHL